MPRNKQDRIRGLQLEITPDRLLPKKSFIIEFYSENPPLWMRDHRETLLALTLELFSKPLQIQKIQLNFSLHSQTEYRQNECPNGHPS